MFIAKSIPVGMCYTCNVHDVDMPMAMELRINAYMKVTSFATLTETICVTGVQSERLLFGDGEEVKAINSINFIISSYTQCFPSFLVFILQINLYFLEILALYRFFMSEIRIG